MQPRILYALKWTWFVNALAYLFLAKGVFSIAHAVSDQYRGSAEVVSPGRYPTIERALQNIDPEAFRHLMAYQWLRAFGALIVGFAILRAMKRQDRLDPFSPDFAGAKEFDELDRSPKP